MAAVGCGVSEEQLLCSICLEVFSAPVSTPCGHIFCRTCIDRHWATCEHCYCPVCKQVFNTKPQLKVNIVLAEMVLEFQSHAQAEDAEVDSVSVEPPCASADVEAAAAGPLSCEVSAESMCEVPPAEQKAGDESSPSGEVVCDLCPEPRLQALKSCLVCLASFCQSHLQPHLSNPRLRKHQLIEALPNLEERMCPEHERPLELFCKDHSHFICLDCTSADHKDHQSVPLKEECEVQQSEVKEQIKERLLQIQAIQSLVELSQHNADAEIQEATAVYNTLIEFMHQSLDSFKQSVEEKHRKREEDAAQMTEQIQTEISALEQRGAEMEQLWSSGDHLHFVQTFTSAKPAPELKDWTNSNICTTYEGILVDTLSKLQDDQLRPEIKKVFKKDLKRFQQHRMHVTLDSDTAHPNISVECYNKKAQYTSTEQKYPDKPERFSTAHFVLGIQSFSSGKAYFEVSVKGSRQWAVGVASESVRRKGNLSPGRRNGFWLLEWDNQSSSPCQVGGYNMYWECMPWVIGVFVDYEAGLVSFFDVGKAVLISSLSGCSFRGPLLPLISPGERYGAMQITT